MDGVYNTNVCCIVVGLIYYCAQPICVASSSYHISCHGHTARTFSRKLSKAPIESSRVESSRVENFVLEEGH